MRRLVGRSGKTLAINIDRECRSVVSLTVSIFSRVSMDSKLVIILVGNDIEPHPIGYFQSGKLVNLARLMSSERAREEVRERGERES